MDKHKVRSQAEVYLAIALALFGLWLQTSGVEGAILLGFAILSAVCFLSLALSLHFKWGWLNRFAGRLNEIQYGNLVLFLGLSGLALSLAQNGYIYWAIAVAVVGYGGLLWGFRRSRASK